MYPRAVPCETECERREMQMHPFGQVKLIDLRIVRWTLVFGFANVKKWLFPYCM